MEHKVIVEEHLKAYTLRPSRAEALWQLASYCRETQRYAEGYLFSKVGMDIPIPKDILFVRRDVYEWRLLDEFSICAYWIERYDEALSACDKIITEGLYALTEKQRIESNKLFSSESLAQRFG